jgi:hypothetical protein
MTEQPRKYPLWCALSGPDGVSLTGHVGREIGQLCLDAIDVRHETGATPRQILDGFKASIASNADLVKERDSLQRRVEELTEAVRFGTELLRGHRYNWEHEQGDEDAPHTGEDCRACEYEALLARFEAALASDSKEGR